MTKGASMGTSIESMGRELARQIHALAALKEEKKEAMTSFKLRDEAIRKEINRLAMDVRTGQVGLYKEPER